MKLPRVIRLTERKLGKEKAVGLCWHGSTPHIELDPRQKSPDRLDTLVLELIHVCFNHLEEKDVEKVANRISSVIWSDGWRRVQE